MSAMTMRWWAVALGLHIAVPGAARSPLQVQSWTATTSVYDSNVALARDVKVMPSAGRSLKLRGGVASDDAVPTSHAVIESSESSEASSDVVPGAETVPGGALDAFPDSNGQPSDTVTLSDPLDSELLERIQSEPKLTRLLTVVGRIPALRNAAAVDVLVRVERAQPEDCLLAAAALVRLASLAKQSRYNSSSSSSSSSGLSGETLRDQIVRDRRFEQCTEVLECRADCLGPQVVFQVLDSLSKLRYRPPRLVAALRAQSLAILAESPAANSTSSVVSRVSDAAWLLYAFAFAEQTLGVDATAVAVASKEVLSEYPSAQLGGALQPTTLVNLAWALGVTQASAPDYGSAMVGAQPNHVDGSTSSGNETGYSPASSGAKANVGIEDADLAGRVFAALLAWLEQNSPPATSAPDERMISQTVDTSITTPDSAAATTSSAWNRNVVKRMLSAQDCAHAAWAVRSLRRPNRNTILAALAKHSEAQLALSAGAAPTAPVPGVNTATQGSTSVKASAKGLIADSAAAAAAAASSLSERRALAEFAWAMAKSGVRPSGRWQKLALARLRPALRLPTPATATGNQMIAMSTEESTVALLPLPVLDVAKVGWALTWFEDDDGSAAEIIRAAFVRLQHQPPQQESSAGAFSCGVQPLLEDTDAAVNLLWATAQLSLRDQASGGSIAGNRPSSAASGDMGCRRSGGSCFAFECAVPLGRLTAALQAHVQQLSFSQVVQVVESCGVLGLAPERLLQSTERRLARAATASVACVSALLDSSARQAATAMGGKMINIETNVAPGDAGVSGGGNVAVVDGSSSSMEGTISLHQAAAVAHAFSSLGYQAPNLFAPLVQLATLSAAQFEAVDLAVLLSALVRAGHSLGPLPLPLPLTPPISPQPVVEPSSITLLDLELNHSMFPNKTTTSASPAAATPSPQEARITQLHLLLPRLSEEALRRLSPSLATQLHWALATKLSVPQELLASSQLIDTSNERAQSSTVAGGATQAATATKAITDAYSELFTRLHADLALKLVLFGPRELVDIATSLAALATRWPSTLALPCANALMDRIAHCLVPQPVQPAPSSSFEGPLAGSSATTRAEGSSSSSSSGHNSATASAAWPPARFSSLQLARLASAFAHFAGRGISDDDNEDDAPSLLVSTPSSIAAARGRGIETGTDRHIDAHTDTTSRALSAAQAMAVKNLHAEAGKRLNKLSSTRSDVFFASNCQQWCQLCFE